MVAKCEAALFEFHDPKNEEAETVTVCVTLAPFVKRNPAGAGHDSSARRTVGEEHAHLRHTPASARLARSSAGARAGTNRFLN
jgi:hypothetical protein